MQLALAQGPINEPTLIRFDTNGKACDVTTSATAPCKSMTHGSIDFFAPRQKIRCGAAAVNIHRHRTPCRKVARGPFRGPIADRAAESTGEDRSAILDPVRPSHTPVCQLGALGQDMKQVRQRHSVFTNKNCSAGTC